MIMETSLLDQYRTSMGDNEYRRYVGRLYRKILLMHSGESFVIDALVAEETKPLFIELLTSFILMHPGEYLFSNDYKKFIKQHADRLEEARKIRANAYRKSIDQGDSEETRSDGIRPQTLHPPGKDFPDQKPNSQPGIRSSKAEVCAS